MVKIDSDAHDVLHTVSNQSSYIISPVMNSPLSCGLLSYSGRLSYSGLEECPSSLSKEDRTWLRSKDNKLSSLYHDKNESYGTHRDRRP